MKVASGLLQRALLLGLCATQSLGLSIGGRPNQLIKPYKRELLQDIVTWDEHTLFVHGERVLFYSGEFHPFRLPVPSLWLDVFQKIRAMGYNGVSFYVHWALLEGKPGDFTAEGVFALEPFFEAASKAGIYLLARPGPYINAEASGGGFPGWLQRVKGMLRTAAEDYLHATDNYVQSVGEIIAKAQITNGGPVILLQPENEYTGAVNTVFPDPNYMNYVEEQYRNAGIVVPFISNDASASGHNAPGQPAAVDIYGHDGYPLGFDCANPYTWPSGSLPTTWRTVHEQQSPNTPYALVEFQGGSFDPWGGLGFDQCGDLLNYEFERVFYKNDFSFGVTIFNIYMTYGGTNWGNLGHPGGYTSYDYGSVIRENRTIDREKYSEAKLEANFLQASTAYWTGSPESSSTSAYSTSSALTVTPIFGNTTSFFVVRHATYNSLDSTTYKLTIPTSAGNLTIPQLSGSLTLNGRDSKIHVADYDLGGVNLLYSTAEVFTWKKYSSKTVLVVYGGPGEQHELAFSDVNIAKTVEGSGLTIAKKNGATVINFTTSSSRRVVQVDSSLYVYILDRNSAYNYWVVPVEGNTPVIVKAGYLIRTASLQGSTLALTGDFNATTTVEIVGSPKLSSISVNGARLQTRTSKIGTLTGTVAYRKPNVNLPTLSSLKWKYIDDLPEIQQGYSDAHWTAADHTTTNNTALRNLTTPTSLYASDYGYHTGSLLYRGHFTATGKESTLYLHTQGGSAFGMSAWLGSTFLGSWAGNDRSSDANTTLTLPNLSAGKSYVLTVLIDHMGLDENWIVGAELMKDPRGILDYTLVGRQKSDITWKLTGNLGGEDYADRVRGPLNEGGLWAERQGYHLPGAPIQGWKDSKGPTAGLSKAGVGFYATTFDLNLPKGYDIPLSFVFSNSSTSSTSSAYRVQLFVNGYQFGKYVHNVGPQDAFPVPEGIFNYHGSNYVAMSLWSLEEGGAKVEGVDLVAGFPVQTGFGEVQMAPVSKWSKRQGAY